jgi:hypothetical protein
MSYIKKLWQGGKICCKRSDLTRRRMNIPTARAAWEKEDPHWLNGLIHGGKYPGLECWVTIQAL